MANDSTIIAIDSVPKLRTRLRSGQFLGNWDRFSIFLKGLESASSKFIDEDTAIATINGTQFPLDSTLQFLRSYLQQHLIEDVFNEETNPAKKKIADTVSRVINEKGSTLDDSWEEVGRRRAAQEDFLSTLLYRLNDILPISEEDEEFTLEEAIPQIIGDTTFIGASKLETLEKLYKEKLHKAALLYKEPKEIKLAEENTKELERREALKKRDPETLTPEEQTEAAQLEAAQTKIQEAQEQLTEKLAKEYKQLVDNLDNETFKEFVKQYSPDANFVQFVIQRLIEKYSKETVNLSNLQGLGYEVRNLIDRIEELTQEFFQKIDPEGKETPYTKAQTTAAKELNTALAEIFNIPVPVTDDTGGAAADEDEEDQQRDEAGDADFLTTLERLESDLEERLDQLPGSARESTLSRLQDIYTGGSARDALQTDSIGQFFVLLANQAENLTEDEQDGIATAIRQYIESLQPLRDKDREEADTAVVPPIGPTEAETGAPPTDGENIRATGELLRVQSLLVLEAENEIRFALEQKGLSEVEIGRLLNSYHDDISNLVWTQFLDVGGYRRQQIGDALSYHELARIWTESGQNVLDQIVLNEQLSNTPVDLATSAQPTGDQVARAKDILTQAGITDTEKTFELIQQLRDPSQFNNLVQQASQVAALHASLKEAFSGTGNYKTGDIQQLINLIAPYLPEEFRNANIARSLATLGIEGNAGQLLQSGSFQLRAQDLNFLQKSGAWLRLQKLTRLVEKLEGEELSADEAKELEQLFREFIPLFSILKDGNSDELFYYVVGAEELNRFATDLAKTHQQEIAVSRRLNTFTQQKYTYTPRLSTYVTTVTTVEVTEVTETTEVSLLTSARDNMMLKKMVVASMVQDAMATQALSEALLIDQQRSLEALLLMPDQATQPQLLNAQTGQPMLPRTELAQMQRSGNEGNASKIAKARQFAKQARMAKMLLSSKGNPYLLAANMLKDPEGRKMIMQAIKAMAATMLAQMMIMIAAIMALIKAALAVWNFLTGWVGPTVQFVQNAWSAAGNFLQGVLQGITGTGTGATSAAVEIGQTAAEGAKNAATTAQTTGNELVQNARAEITNAANTAGAQSQAILTSTVAAETSATIITAGLLGPFILIGIFTFIVITVIGASLNDIPMGSTQRSISQGGLGVAGCWPTNGSISVLDRYTGGPNAGKPHAVSPGGSAIDIGAAINTPIYTPFNGTAQSAWDDSYGNYVIIETDYGFTVYLAHMVEACVPSLSGGCLPDGQSGPVTAGQQVGLVGSTGNSTGPHLHYEVLNVPSSLTTADYAIAEIVPPEPPLAVGAQVSTSQCGTGNNITVNACFRFEDGAGTWTDAEKSGIETVAMAVEAYGSERFQNDLCGRGPITIVRQGNAVSTDGFPYAGEVKNRSTMYIYDYCFDSSQANCQFTFPHELGHIYHNRKDILTAFNAAAGSEGVLFTYPLPDFIASGGGSAVRESFAEAFGTYIGQEWLGFSTNRCLPGSPNVQQGQTTCRSFSLQSEKPLQYQFLQENVF